MDTDEPLCAVCDFRPVHCDDRCMACYQYRRRNGHDAPIAVIIRRGHGRPGAHRHKQNVA